MIDRYASVSHVNPAESVTKEQFQTGVSSRLAVSTFISAFKMTIVLDNEDDVGK